MLKYVNKINTVQTKRVGVQKQIKMNAIDPNKLTHKERLQEIKLQQEEERKQQTRKIQTGIKQRE